MEHATHVLEERIPRPKVSKVQTIATNARPGKRTLTKVLLRVVIVLIVLPIQHRKMKDPQHAFLVVLVKQQPKEVPNATEPHAKRARSTTLILERVQSAHTVGHRKSWTPQDVHNARSAQPH